MHIGALKHLLSVVRAIQPDGAVIVFGSASSLATFPEEGGDGGVLQSTYDADLIPEPYSDLIAKALWEAVGKQRSFSQLHGYYADIVRPEAFEQFPPGWRDRLVPLDGFDRVWCLEPHDMAAAKCLAGRPKDIEQLGGLAAKGKIDLDLVHQRLWSMDLVEKMIVHTQASLQRVRERAAEIVAVLSEKSLPS